VANLSLRDVGRHSSEGGVYAFEPKWDGFRCLVSRSGELRAVSRRGWDNDQSRPRTRPTCRAVWYEGCSTQARKKNARPMVTTLAMDDRIQLVRCMSFQVPADRPAGGG
jgi:hypothetical protein